MNTNNSLGAYLWVTALSIQDSYERFNKQFNEITKASPDKHRINYEDFEVYSFPETWGSTALGFGGIGGAAMTTAQTVVCVCYGTNSANVYFNGRYAYTVNGIKSKFWQHLRKFEMPDVYKYHELEED